MRTRSAQFADRIENLTLVSKENIALGQTVRFEAPESAIIGSYLHLQNGRGVNAVLVEMTGADESLAHDIALHIAFARPEYLRREDVPAEQIEDVRQTAAAIARNEGKPRGRARTRSSRAGSRAGTKSASCSTNPSSATSSTRSGSCSAARSCFVLLKPSSARERAEARHL